MDKAQALAHRWATATKIGPGVTLRLPEGEAVVLDKAPGHRQWWAWSVTEQVYVLVRDHDKRGTGGWYEYRKGDGHATD